MLCPFANVCISPSVCTVAIFFSGSERVGVPELMFTDSPEPSVQEMFMQSIQKCDHDVRYDCLPSTIMLVVLR